MASHVGFVRPTFWLYKEDAMPNDDEEVSYKFELKTELPPGFYLFSWNLGLPPERAGGPHIEGPIVYGPPLEVEDAD